MLLGPGPELDVVVDAGVRPLASDDVTVNVAAGAASCVDENLIAFNIRDAEVVLTAVVDDNDNDDVVVGDPVDEMVVSSCTPLGSTCIEYKTGSRERQPMSWEVVGNVRCSPFFL